MATLEVDVTEATRRDKVLTALALAGGNSVRAAESVDVDERTIRRYRRRYETEYERIRRELAPRLEAIVLDELRAFIVDAAHVERLCLAKLNEALEAGEIPKRDLAACLRNITTSRAISIDKTLALSGRPTIIHEHRSANELVSRLAKLGAVVDGSAVEIGPAVAVADAPGVRSADAVASGDAVVDEKSTT